MKRILELDCRNKAINLSKGELIAFCDADDIWQKDKLNYQIKIINEKKVDFYTLIMILLIANQILKPIQKHLK